jgi:UDP-2,3-diacylglucosamine pyrophosphatase LpxH
MKKKTIDLSEISRGLAEGPLGKEKVKKLETEKQALTEALLQTLKRVRPYEIPVRSPSNTIRFGLIGDTQIGSLYQRIDALEKFYEHCAADGIKIILHAGDVLDGWKVYKGQEFELHPEGGSWAGQRRLFADRIPRIDGLMTVFITGNHDASFKKLIGMSPGEELARTRDDWKFIGEDTGMVVLKAEDGQKLRIQLLHPGGGTAYAVSYHVQKIIESLAGGEKPDIICVGHYHKADFLPDYRNIAAFQTGCFQSQTPFMVQHSLAAHIGGWIVTVPLNDRRHLTASIEARFIKFFEEQK